MTSVADREDIPLDTFRNELLLLINLLRTETFLLKRARSVKVIMLLGSQQSGHGISSCGRLSMGPCQDDNILGTNDES